MLHCTQFWLVQPTSDRWKPQPKNRWQASLRRCCSTHPTQIELRRHLALQKNDKADFFSNCALTCCCCCSWRDIWASLLTRSNSSLSDDAVSTLGAVKKKFSSAGWSNFSFARKEDESRSNFLSKSSNLIVSISSPTLYLSLISLEIALPSCRVRLESFLNFISASMTASYHTDKRYCRLSCGFLFFAVRTCLDSMGAEVRYRIIEKNKLFTVSAASSFCSIAASTNAPNSIGNIVNMVMTTVEF